MRELKMKDQHAKISALSTSKIDKHECLTGKEIFPPDQYRLIEQDKFIIYHLEKNLKSK